LRFTRGLQGGARFGLTKLLGAKVDVDLGSREFSLVTGKEYVNESYAFGIDIGGFSFGLDASRSVQVFDFKYRQDSVAGFLSGRPFEFKPAFQTPWNISAKEFWKIDFGASALLGLEGNLDFGHLDE